MAWGISSALTCLVLLLGVWFANKLLSYLALNHWNLQPQGEAWVLDGKTELAVVTGGSSGFGRCIAHGLSSKMRVIVLDVNEIPDDLKAISNITFFQCDLTSNSSILDTLRKIKEHGSPTVLINNAGIGTSHTMLETSDAWLEKIFRVNVMSHFTLIRELLPGMLAQRKGHIFTVASIASYAATASLVDYCSTKAAALSLHQGLTQELRHRYPNGHCIRTSSIHPFWARTGLVKSWESTLEANGAPLLDPQEVADAVVNQVFSAKSGQLFLPKRISIITGVNGWPIWMQELLRGISAKNTIRAA